MKNNNQSYFVINYFLDRCFYLTGVPAVGLKLHYRIYALKATISKFVDSPRMQIENTKSLLETPLSLSYQAY